MSKIHKDFYEEIDMAQLPGYETMLGFQMECLLLQNRSALLKAVGISYSDCVLTIRTFKLNPQKIEDASLII